MILIQGNETQDGARDETRDGVDDLSTCIFKALICFSAGVDDLRSAEGRH